MHSFRIMHAYSYLISSDSSSSVSHCSARHCYFRVKANTRQSIFQGKGTFSCGVEKISLSSETIDTTYYRRELCVVQRRLNDSYSNRGSQSTFSIGSEWLGCTYCIYTVEKGILLLHSSITTRHSCFITVLISFMTIAMEGETKLLFKNK